MYVWKDDACDKNETGEGFGIPNGIVWSGNLDDEKGWREESRCIWYVVLETSHDMSVMNGEKHEYIRFFNMTVCLL